MGLSGITDACEKELLEALLPLKAVRRYNLCFLEGSIKLEGTSIAFSGYDINAHLKGCTACVLFTVTLGLKVDSVIKRAQIESMAKAVILDRMANEAASGYADNVLKQIKTENPHTTGIFSPGCGDFSICYQERIIECLNAYKLCGISVTESGVLVPSKSLTGVVGVSSSAVKGVLRGCGNSTKKNCGYEKNCILTSGKGE